MKSGALLLAVVLLSVSAHAEISGILRGTDLTSTNLSEAVQDVTPGSIVVIGENHGLKEHQSQQLEIMSALRAQGLKVSVGLEFLHSLNNISWIHTVQGLTEPDFLKAIQWSSPSYDYYRDQALFPVLSEGSKTWA